MMSELGIQPGIYDFSNDDYHGSPGISRSALMKFRKSPYHYWHHYLNPLREPEKQTPALILGNALHTLTLEPELFNSHYFVVPRVDKRTKEGRALWVEVESIKGNRQTISEDDYNQINLMAQSLKLDCTAENLIGGAQYEKSIYWKDNDTKILCKARPDILHANMVCDLKTCVDASYYAFQRSVYDYGYHIQAAMIQDAIKSVLNKTIFDFIFIAVEKEPPYAVGIYILSSDALKKGQEDYKKLLVEYKDCWEQNYWPGYKPQIISLPKYAA